MYRLAIRLAAVVVLTLSTWLATDVIAFARANVPYKSPLGLAVDKEGKTAYVALHTAGAVAVVDVGAGKLLQEWPVGKGPNDLVLSGGKLYVTCEHDDCVVLLDAATGKQHAKFAVGQGPLGVGTNEKGTQVFFA